jgi:hypothetical protein
MRGKRAPIAMLASDSVGNSLRDALDPASQY